MVSSSFLNKQIPKNNLKGLCGILESGELSDYTLKTKDELCIKTHKFILRSSSSFFDKLFANNFKDSNEDHLVLENVSFCVLNKIVKYLYSGAIVIEEELVQEVLDIALFLQLIELVDKCTDILCESLNEENCFELLKYSKTYNQSDKLKNKCIQFILQNLNALINNQEFVNISLNDIKSLISTEITNFERDEEQIYLALEKWLTYNLESREQYIHDLMDGIRFENISRQFGVSRILKNNPLMENKNFLQNIVKIIETDWRKVERKICPGLNTSPLCAIIEDKIFSISYEDNKISKIVTQLPKYRQWFGSCIFASKNIFLSGGSIDNADINTCEYYSIEEGLWKVLPPMEVSRSCIRSVTISDKIYVCGGYQNKTVEIFDIGKSIWSKGPSLNREMVHPNRTKSFGLCSKDNCIYALNELYFQFLDIRENMWNDLAGYNNGAILSAIAYDNFIFGFRSNGFNSFDVRYNSWLNSNVNFDINSMGSPVSCISNEKMFVFDKFNSTQKKYSLLTYNLNNLWCESSRFIKLPIFGDCWYLFPI